MHPGAVVRRIALQRCDRMDLEEYKPGWKRFVYLALNAEEGHKVFEFCKWDATLSGYNPYEFVIESDRIWIAVLPRAWGQRRVSVAYTGDQGVQNGIWRVPWPTLLFMASEFLESRELQ